MTKEEALDWIIARKEHYELDDSCQPLAEALGMAIKALEQKPCEDAKYKEPTNMIDYRRAFKIACDLLNGAVLYGVDTDKIFELMMQKDGIVSNSSYEDYILNHLQELDQGQYASSSEKIEHVREFEGIEVNYPPEELCTYPEYKGKPYFGIKYKENGEEIVGYGTYNPQVLSRYLKDYFMPTTKNDLAVDCIDREELLKAMDTWDKFGYTVRYGLERLDKNDKDFVPYVKYADVVNCVKNMPSVTPQEPFKPMVEIDLYSVVKQKYIEREVLDKIRADVINIADSRRSIPVRSIINILDKYKVEK